MVLNYHFSELLRVADSRKVINSLIDDTKVQNFSELCKYLGQNLPLIPVKKKVLTLTHQDYFSFGFIHPFSR